MRQAPKTLTGIASESAYAPPAIAVTVIVVPEESPRMLTEVDEV